jgi:hypothetical protein
VRARRACRLARRRLRARPHPPRASRTQASLRHARNGLRIDRADGARIRAPRAPPRRLDDPARGRRPPTHGTERPRSSATTCAAGSTTSLCLR